MYTQIHTCKQVVSLFPLQCNVFFTILLTCCHSLTHSYLSTLPLADDGSPTLLFEDICPASFMFFPAKPVESERDEFVNAASRLEQQQQQRVIWIVKPSDGCKGTLLVDSKHTTSFTATSFSYSSVSTLQVDYKHVTMLTIECFNVYHVRCLILLFSIRSQHYIVR